MCSVVCGMWYVVCCRHEKSCSHCLQKFCGIVETKLFTQSLKQPSVIFGIPLLSNYNRQKHDGNNHMNVYIQFSLSRLILALLITRFPRPHRCRSHKQKSSEVVDRQHLENFPKISDNVLGMVNMPGYIGWARNGQNGISLPRRVGVAGRTS